MVTPSYADGDGYFQIVYLMERAHDSLTAGLDSLLKQVLDDHSKDLANWLGYVGAWVTCVDHHHHAEETVLFPFFEAHGFHVTTELAQHQKLHQDLSKVQELLDAPSAYEFEKLESLLRETNLEPYMTSDDLKQVIADFVAQGKDGDPFINPVFMHFHTPPEHQGWYDLGYMNFVFYRLILPLMSLRHSGYWKYAPFV
ncbi:hypothetical protein BZG36_00266 [Bifiguratus adelaidae]|uniref:Hemerythrin-like domain-containing protein n=1 Tax=Bifiguratus adelaidae TaxID=1938954 RepID=A0A261Y7Z8_9FUNG|nr:hypothetical protein BZG36_00266 [Bifiguratus adelaidae]